MPRATAPGGRDHEVPHVEVEVVGLGAWALWNTWTSRSMAGVSTRRPVDAGLLLGLPERDAGQVAVAVGVTARLEPALHLGVEQQQHLAGARVDRPPPSR